MHQESPVKLSPEQIEALFIFCKQHKVEYYDVQLELVDHMAASIEWEMAKDNSLSFESALGKVFKSFGYKGFSGVLASRERIMTQWYGKQQWKIFLSYFTWPKATLTVMIMAVLYTLRLWLSLSTLKYVIGGTLLSLIFLELILLMRLKKGTRAPHTPLLMLKRARLWNFQSFIVINVYFSILNGKRWIFHDSDSVAHSLNAYGYYCFIIAFSIMVVMLLAVYNVREKVNRMAEDKYPGAYEPAE